MEALKKYLKLITVALTITVGGVVVGVTVIDGEAEVTVTADQ